MKKPSIAIMHYSSFPVIGGVEIIIDAHARLFKTAGYPVKLITGTGEKGAHNIQTVIIPEISSFGGQYSGILKKLFSGIVPHTFEKAVESLRKKIEKTLKDVDICIMHNILTMHFNLILTAALARIISNNKTKKEFIGWIHDSTFCDPVYEKQQIHRYPWSLLREPIPGCRYCVLTHHRQKEISRIFGVPLSYLPVIPDGIDFFTMLGVNNRIKQLYRQLHLGNKDIIAITPSRLLRRKNLEAAMSIVAAIKNTGTSIRWLITGAPDTHGKKSMKYYTKLLLIRRKLNIQREVVFLHRHIDSPLSFDDVRCLYMIADVLLFPSEREGFGIPLLEAGILKIPIVANDIPVLRELGGTNILYIKKDERPEKTAEQLLNELNNKITAFRNLIRKKFSWERVFNKKILPALIEPETVWKIHKHGDS